MQFARTITFLRVALVLAPLSLGLTACETLESLNPLDTPKTPLKGDRRAVFPQGVPGVQYSAPPTQPTNSNVQLTPQDMQQNQTPDAQPQQEAEQPPARQTRTKQARTKQAPAANTEDDPWAGQRR